MMFRLRTGVKGPHGRAPEGDLVETVERLSLRDAE